MKISVVTICRNSAETIGDCVASVNDQDHPEVEHIVVDGASEDGTVEAVRSMESRVARLISEPDEGLYDALNKGVRAATGQVVGTLNSDDMYHRPDVLSSVAAAFREGEADLVYGDVHFVRGDNLHRTVRYFSSRRFRPWKMRFGFMPAHPSMFYRRELFERYGYYDTDYEISADFEHLLRLQRQGVKTRYLPLNMVKMRAGGVSNASLRNRYVLTREVIRACRENGLYTNWAMQLMKYPVKVFEMIRKEGSTES